MKKIIFIAIAIIGVGALGAGFYFTKSKLDNQKRSKRIEKPTAPTHTLVAPDTRVPICPAHPEGAKAFSGTGYLFGGNEHSGCTTEHCLIDLREEKRAKGQNDELKQLLNELGK